MMPLLNETSPRNKEFSEERKSALALSRKHKLKWRGKITLPQEVGSEEEESRRLNSKLARQ